MLFVSNLTVSAIVMFTSIRRTFTASHLVNFRRLSLFHFYAENPRCSHLTHILTIRGGTCGGDNQSDSHLHPTRTVHSKVLQNEKEFKTLANPAPGSPFHYAFPVHSLEEAKQFYGSILGCQEGRSSSKWQDYSLHGHQIVCHWVGDNYRCVDYFNPVDGDEVPVPHAGLALTVEEFHALAKRLRDAGVKFIIEPHLRFKDMPGEQWTMFFKDPSGNNLEFKAMTQIENLFAKYNVVE